MEQPLFSVVMLTCHRNKAISETAQNCYASIINSSENYELIVVDNASTIDTSWLTPHVLVKNNVNRGIAPAWNMGIKLARAPYIAVVNDDIVVQKGWLERLKGACDMPNAGVANLYVEHLPQGAGLVENYKWFSGSCFMLKRTTISRIGYFDEQYEKANFEDHDYWTRVLRAGLKLYVDYGMSIQHKEGQTVHDKDISAHFLANKARFLKKWGFDSQKVFCGDAPFPFH